MIYHVRFTDGSTQDFEDWTPDTTITQVKEAIKTFKSVSHIDLIRLIFGGRILKNPDTLQKSGIESGSTFHCVIRAEPLESPIAPQVATGGEEGVAGGMDADGGDEVNGGGAGGMDAGGVAGGHGNLEELLQTLGLQNMTMDISGGGLEGLGLGGLGGGGLGGGLGGGGLGGGLGGGIGLQFLQQFLQTLQDSSNNIIQHLNDTSGNQITMTIPLTGGGLNTGDDNDEGILGGEHVTPENIQTLVGMGFNDNVDMRIALRLSNGNIQHAVEYLLNL